MTAALVEWIGAGLFIAVSAVFFVRVAGLSPGQVGPGLAIAGGVAMTAALPIARLADARGPRNVLIAVNLARAAATACYLLVHDWWSFLAVSVVVAVTEQAAPPLIQALVGGLVRQDMRTRVMAAHRTVINLGISVGGLIAGLVLGGGMEGAFRVLLLADAAGFVGAAALLLRLAGPRDRPTAGPAARWAALRDRRLLALTAYDGVMSLHLPVLNVAFPLWLATRTDAPVSLVGLLYAVATVTCVLLQYPAGRLAATPRSAWWSYAAAGAFVALAGLGFAWSGRVSGGATVGVLTGSIVVLTLGELLVVGAAWTLSYALAPAASRNIYLATFGAGRMIGSRIAGPWIMTGVVLALGTAGWIILAAVFLAAACVAGVAAVKGLGPATEQ
jgi:MFS family permease